jgi:hypothetical protein
MNWKTIARYMAANGVAKDHQKARQKFNSLKAQYNKVKAAMNCTGNGAEDVPTFDYFDLMDEVLGSRDSATLKYVEAIHTFNLEGGPLDPQQSAEVSARPDVGEPSADGVQASPLVALQPLPATSASAMSGTEPDSHAIAPAARQRQKRRRIANGETAGSSRSDALHATLVREMQKQRHFYKRMLQVRMQQGRELISVLSSLSFPNVQRSTSGPMDISSDSSRSEPESSNDEEQE